jgi:hypothetical protein
MDANREWHRQYEAWRASAILQFRSARTDLASEDGHVEVCEDGSVYLGNLAWLPAGTVTPWEEN